MTIPQDLLLEIRKLKQEEVSVKPFDTKKAFINIALLYPSPYRVAMSSLGFQTIYRLFNEMNGVNCERSFLPDKPAIYHRRKTKLFTIETESEVQNFDIVALSVAYELELLGVAEVLELANLPPLAEERRERFHPLVIAGGPLTFSNPLPLGVFADVILLGEAEGLITTFTELYREAESRKTLLKTLSELPGFYIPSIHGNELPAIAKAEHHLLPAFSQIITPNTELANMFLIEPERGCSRGCTFCVMRRSTNNGMRLLSPELVLQKIPDFIDKVGLVGAAVSDHPRITDILEELVIGQKKQIGISSLRADRLTPRFVELLSKGGYKTLTVASDGASERIRNQMQKRIKEKYLLRSAEYAREYNMRYLKIYMMLGVPGESEDDIDELIEFSERLANITKVSLGIAPFVAKKNTPMDKEPFEGINQIEQKLKKLRKYLKQKVEIRSTSAKWAWVEYQLAQGSLESGYAVLDAYRLGGKFSDWKQAFNGKIQFQNKSVV